MSQHACLVLVALVAIAAPLAFGDDYQFIISGDPVAAATVNSHSAESATAALDGVYRTVAESATTFLYTDKIAGTMVLIR